MNLRNFWENQFFGYKFEAKEVFEDMSLQENSSGIPKEIMKIQKNQNVSEIFTFMKSVPIGRLFYFYMHPIHSKIRQGLVVDLKTV